jgi:hypothetical protein
VSAEPTGLPWDVYATPIRARKLARLGVAHAIPPSSGHPGTSERIVLQPAFFRQLGGDYAVADRAMCPLQDHDAPAADCTCGFYAVEHDDELWRLGSYEPELAVLDVDLAGRVVEHEHGYRASDQRVRRVTVGNTCVRCGRPAVALRRHWFGGLTPACERHARRPVALDTVSHALGVPVAFSTEDAVAAPRGKRLRFVLAQLVAPILILLVGIGLAFAVDSGVPLNFAQLGVLAWLLVGPMVFDHIAPRFGLGRRETVRLQRRWSWLVVCVVIACDLLITVVAALVWDAMTA